MKTVAIIILAILLAGCIPVQKSYEIEFIDTAMINHKGCVRPEFYDPTDPQPVCVPNYNYTLAKFNLRCERTNESMHD